MSAPEHLLRAAKKHGGKLQKGECYHSTGMEQVAANSLAAELKLLHYQVRGVVQEKCGTWEVIFR